jgi:hypothetical protein
MIGPASTSSSCCPGEREGLDALDLVGQESRAPACSCVVVEEVRAQGRQGYLADAHVVYDHRYRGGQIAEVGCWCSVGGISSTRSLQTPTALKSRSRGGGARAHHRG